MPVCICGCACASSLLLYIHSIDSTSNFDLLFLSLLLFCAAAEKCNRVGCPGSRAQGQCVGGSDVTMGLSAAFFELSMFWVCRISLSNSKDACSLTGSRTGEKSVLLTCFLLDCCLRMFGSAVKVPLHVFFVVVDSFVWLKNKQKLMPVILPLHCMSVLNPVEG